MKTLISSVLFLLLLPPIVHAQTDPCDGKKYAYEYINPHTCQEEFKCVNDPQTDAPAGFVPVRWATGTVIPYSTSNIAQLCVDATALNKCIDDAFCAWSSLASCGDIIAPFQVMGTRVAANPNDHSILPINGTMVNQEFPPGSGFHEFGDNNDVVRNTIAITIITPFCSGNINLYTTPKNRSFIDINMTSTYNAGNIDVYPCNHSTGSCAGGEFRPPVDLCVAISHEIGHLMGCVEVNCWICGSELKSSSEC